MNQFLGEIRIIGRSAQPQGWARCDGRLLSISEYPLLHQLIGTTYGGDGDTTFALPDLRGRTPIHQGAGNGLTPRQMGQMLGAEEVVLSAQELPAHSHPVLAFSNIGNRAEPNDCVWAAASTGERQYTRAPADAVMAPDSTTSSGGSQGHPNMMPCLCLSFMIALEGIYPVAA